MSVMGLTYQSSRLQTSMSEHLMKMAKEASRAAAHQEPADADLALSSQEMKKAAIDKTKGQALQEEADALFAKGEEDEALAATEETAADGEAAKAAGEEEQAVAKFAEAGSLQAAVDADRIEAGAESAAAARAEFTAHGDELGTGICEFVPVLDVVCDILGGTAAVGLEATAAKDAAESAALIAGAVEAETKEKAEMAFAVELQSEAAEDGEVATEGHAAAAQLETEAETELAEAQEEETAAQERQGQSVIEEEAAEEEEGKAMEEEAQSDASFVKSAEHGVAACWDACFATVVSLVAVGFFAVRFTSMIALSATTHLPRVTSYGASGFPLRHFSQISLHCIIFGITLGYFGSSFFAYFDSLQARARGGIILLFALNVAAAQALLLHSLPVIWSLDGSCTSRLKAFSWAFLSSVACLFPLIILEFLILRVTFGTSLFTAKMLNELQEWYIWVVFGFSLISYYWLFERRGAAQSEIQTVRVISGSESPSWNSNNESSYGTLTTEKSAAYSPETVPLTSTAAPELETTTQSRLATILRYFERYQLPFDLLIAACAFAVLRICLPNLRRLWPISKTIILAAHPRWWIVAVVVCVAVVLVGASVFCLCRMRQRYRNGERELMHN